MTRKILAVVFGIVIALVIIIAIEALSHAVYPMPEGLDLTNQEALQAMRLALYIEWRAVCNVLFAPLPACRCLTRLEELPGIFKG